MSITSTGEWVEELNYSTYPKENWCSFDIIAYWIRGYGYSPKTSMKNLILNILSFAEDHFENKNVVDYSSDDIKSFVLENGGFDKFDFAPDAHFR